MTNELVSTLSTTNPDAQALLKEYLELPNKVLAIILGDAPISKTAASKLQRLLEVNPALADVRGVRVPEPAVLTDEQKRAWVTVGALEVLLTFDRKVSARLDGDAAGSAPKVRAALLAALAGKLA
ncbi:MAG: hypothetical protein JNM69_38740 [Archangium sp.]|nr:hypothetical protein [Archangium sp.]